MAHANPQIELLQIALECLCAEHLNDAVKLVFVVLAPEEVFSLEYLRYHMAVSTYSDCCGKRRHTIDASMQPTLHRSRL